MILVWINRRSWKRSGPIVNVAVQNAMSFAAIGCETHLCIGKGTDSETAEDLEKVYGLRPLPNFTVHRIAPRWGLRDSTPVLFAAFRLICELRKRHPVAVLTRESTFLAPLAWLCRHPNVSGFYELHDFYADLSWLPRRKTSFYREHFLERLFLPRINGIICITQEQQKLYQRVFPGLPACAFPLGTRPLPAPVPDEERRKRRTVLYVGSLHWEKGLDFLLRSAPGLARAGIRLLCLGGKPETCAGLREWVRGQGLAGTVAFEPFQPLEGMHQRIAEQASLGVVMIQDTFYNRYLTCPVKALDYLSHGLPVIGSDLPSVREVLGRAGIFLTSDAVETFVGTVCQLLADPHRYAAACTLAQDRALELTWQKRAGSIMDFVTGHST
jgi:glycosyltransferase involved in cell wall biosynthesis